MSFYLRNDQDKENQHTLCTYQIMMFFNALASLREPFETDLQITILLKFLFQSTISIINFLLWERCKKKGKKTKQVLVLPLHIHTHLKN